MAGTAVLTLRLDPKLKKQLDRLSSAINRSRSFVAAEAIREYVTLNNWQIEETIKGVAEADRGNSSRRASGCESKCGDNSAENVRR